MSNIAIKHLGTTAVTMWFACWSEPPTRACCRRRPSGTGPLTTSSTASGISSSSPAWAVAGSFVPTVAPDRPCDRPAHHRPGPPAAPAGTLLSCRQT
jgi:hypothetical protein